MAAQASFLGLTGAAPVIPIVRNIDPDDYKRVKLEEEVNVGTEDAPRFVKRKAEVFKADRKDIELLIRTIIEFDDVAGPARLNIDSGEKKFAQFRLCLDTTLRDDWDIVVASLDEDDMLTNQVFRQARREWLRKYFNGTDYADQLNYMEKFVKPFKLTVQQVADRIVQIDRLLAYFPQAEGNEPYDEDDHKRIFYQSMLKRWKDKFIDNDHDYQEMSFERVVRKFENYERVQNNLDGQRNNRSQGTNRQAGRQFQGRGGRGGRFNRGGGRFQYQGGRGNNYYGNNNYRSPGAVFRAPMGVPAQGGPPHQYQRTEGNAGYQTPQRPNYQGGRGRGNFGGRFSPSPQGRGGRGFYGRGGRGGYVTPTPHAPQYYQENNTQNQAQGNNSANNHQGNHEDANYFQMASSDYEANNPFPSPVITEETEYSDSYYYDEDTGQEFHNMFYTGDASYSFGEAYDYDY